MLTYLFVSPHSRIALLGETQFVEANSLGFVFSFVEFEKVDQFLSELKGIRKKYRVHKENADFYMGDQFLFKFQGELLIFEGIDDALKNEFDIKKLNFHIKKGGL